MRADPLLVLRRQVLVQAVTWIDADIVRMSADTTSSTSMLPLIVCTRTRAEPALQGDGTGTSADDDVGSLGAADGQ